MIIGHSTERANTDSLCGSLYFLRKRQTKNRSRRKRRRKIYNMSLNARSQCSLIVWLIVLSKKKKKEKKSKKKKKGKCYRSLNEWEEN